MPVDPSDGRELANLMRSKAELKRQIAQATDDGVKASLQSALDAVEARIAVLRNS